MKYTIYYKPESKKFGKVVTFAEPHELVKKLDDIMKKGGVVTEVTMIGTKVKCGRNI